MVNSDSGAVLSKTPLHDLHVQHKAKLVPFAGYEMPVTYPLGILKEHQHTREHVGLFDVSHMGQIRIAGNDAALALESLVPMDIVDLPVMQQRYALFTNDQGGIRDDLMITNLGDSLMLVVNAACKSDDLAYLQRKIGQQCSIECLPDQALLALQGPASAEQLAGLIPGVDSLLFMQANWFDFNGETCLISRSGYTGEDGFEISLSADSATSLASELLAHESVEFIGLGARDSLRLEAGLCLYGHDIDNTTTPVEAGLGWALSRARRTEGARAGGYPGSDIILQQLEESASVTRRRVGLKPQGRAPVREGAVLKNPAGQQVGHVTSGGFSPTVGAPVAMGYVDADYASVETQLLTEVRQKEIPVKVVKLPFVPQRYYRGKSG